MQQDFSADAGFEKHACKGIVLLARGDPPMAIRTVLKQQQYSVYLQLLGGKHSFFLIC